MTLTELLVSKSASALLPLMLTWAVFTSSTGLGHFFLIVPLSDPSTRTLILLNCSLS